MANADQIQFDELTKFEALRSQLNARILGFSNRKYPPYTAGELVAFVSELQEWRKQILTFDSVGQQLTGWGLPELYPARISALSSLLAATMNQKSSFREDPHFVSRTASAPRLHR